MLKSVIENNDIDVFFFFFDAVGDFRAVFAYAYHGRWKMILKLQGFIIALTLSL